MREFCDQRLQDKVQCNNSHHGNFQLSSTNSNIIAAILHLIHAQGGLWKFPVGVGRCLLCIFLYPAVGTSLSSAQVDDQYLLGATAEPVPSAVSMVSSHRFKTDWSPHFLPLFHSKVLQ